MLFAACTRARDQLLMSGTGALSTFLPEDAATLPDSGGESWETAFQEPWGRGPDPRERAGHALGKILARRASRRFTYCEHQGNYSLTLRLPLRSAWLTEPGSGDQADRNTVDGSTT